MDEPRAWTIRITNLGGHHVSWFAAPPLWWHYPQPPHSLPTSNTQSTSAVHTMWMSAPSRYAYGAGREPDANL